ncbi:hypothetical protein [Terrisporobacter hibernicus]|uniref:Uncharacterized protein n=1 Tax=Terrisporobacter hibernicus TaxID=2813371 RepID=A0AAX2ZIS5_9FIRM|nr:hypothetical protein [Terrisporobacter hibernicus]UEL48285.1 hypothetical protein JW646_02195 [Terrisporobacter hibernicus]
MSRCNRKVIIRSSGKEMDKTVLYSLFYDMIEKDLEKDIKKSRRNEHEKENNMSTKS